MFRTRRFKIRKTSTRKNEWFFVIIAICHNETGLLYLTVLNVTYNHPRTLPSTYLTDQNLAYTNKVKISSFCKLELEQVTCKLLLSFKIIQMQKAISIAKKCVQ